MNYRYNLPNLLLYNHNFQHYLDYKKITFNNIDYTSINLENNDVKYNNYNQLNKINEKLVINKNSEIKKENCIMEKSENDVKSFGSCDDAITALLSLHNSAFSMKNDLEKPKLIKCSTCKRNKPINCFGEKKNGKINRLCLDCSIMKCHYYDKTIRRKRIGNGDDSIKVRKKKYERNNIIENRSPSSVRINH